MIAPLECGKAVAAQLERFGESLAAVVFPAVVEPMLIAVAAAQSSLAGPPGGTGGSCSGVELESGLSRGEACAGICHDQRPKLTTSATAADALVRTGQIRSIPWSIYDLSLPSSHWNGMQSKDDDQAVFDLDEPGRGHHHRG